MKFRTTCSHCDSVFRLTTEQLDAKNGWAQCGVCGAAFNAHTTLAAENGDPLPTATEPLSREEAVNPFPPDPLAAETPSDPAPALLTHASDSPDLPSDPPSATPLPGIESRAGGPDLSSIILIDPDAEVTDDYGPMPHFSGVRTVKNASATPTGSIYGPTYWATSAAAPQHIKQDFTADLSSGPQMSVVYVAPTRSGISSVLWTLLSLVLLLGLLLQSGYFLRDILASKAPATRPWLEAACAQIGCSLSLPKDAALMQIIGSDLQAEPAGPGHLQLKLTLGNRAAYAQAWPVIVLTLTDARDQAQARRSFAPSEYLPDPKQLASGIPALSEYPLSLPLEVRNLAMAGYRLELVY